MLLTLLLAAAAAPIAPAMLAEVSSPLNDYNYSEDRAGRTAVFARSEAEFANARILVREKRRGRWSAPVPIAFSDARYSDSDPWLTPDGKTLYFVSNRPVTGDTPKRDLDIWRSSRTATGWAAPEHLDLVNSAGPELGPEVHDGMLLFASVRAGGAGGLDIYVAKANGGRFGAPQPIPGPFNSAGSDSDFTLSASGRTAAFWRSHGGGAKLMIAHRTGSGWTVPQALPDPLNPGPFNFTPSFAPDGRSIWFASTRPRVGQATGMADIFKARLPRLSR